MLWEAGSKQSPLSFFSLFQDTFIGQPHWMENDQTGNFLFEAISIKTSDIALDISEW